MGLVELIAMSKTSNYYKNMVFNVFNRKYANKVFVISDVPNVYMDNILSNMERVEINVESAQQILKTFGHMIQKVFVHYQGIKREQSRNINAHIGQYCSKSLIELYFYLFRENPLMNITNSFDKLELVSFMGFGGVTVSIGSDALNLSDMFPALRHLIFLVDDLKDKASMSLVYPHLTEFDVILKRNALDQAAIEDILKKNPQIKSLNVVATTISMLQKVNDILPNLEKLSFSLGYGPEVYDYSDEIRFKNVKRLDISFLQNPATNIVFDQLEEVRFEDLGYPMNG